MRTPGKKTLLVVLCAMSLMVAGILPAAAQTATAARAFGFGIDAALGGEPLLDELPSCTAEIPPELQDACEDTVLDLPVDPLLVSATVHTENAVSAAGGLDARLGQEIDDFAGAGVAPTTNLNALGYAVTEDLSVADDLVTAEVVQGEAGAACVGGQPVFSSGANVANLAIADTEILAPILDALQIDLSPVLNLTQAPNTLVVDLAPLLRITFWETNWDGATGVTDGGNTVVVNALRVEVLTADDGGLIDLDFLGGLLGGDADDIDPDDPLAGIDPGELEARTATLDIRVSHAEASVDCEEDRIGLGKVASSDTVAPGDIFDYTINIPNDKTCTFTNVRVEDTITGPAGFTITGTNPPADTVDVGQGTATVIWNDVGPIEPNQSRQLTISVQVPTNAPAGSQFAEDLVVTADCDGVPITGELRFDGPTVRAPVGPALPRTGSVALIAGLAFMAFGAGLMRLRR